VNTLPTRRDGTDPAPTEHDEDVPTWRELRERAADLMREILREGKELERDLEPKLLPALKNLKAQIEKLIARVEERAKQR
jgi:signal transduction histidine kinase